MTGEPLILVHAGAGAFSAHLQSQEGAVRDVLTDLLARAASELERGGDAASVVVDAVATMESFELFNAGRGSALCADGSVAMSAAVMRGSDRAAGAVAGIRTLEHPILAARLLLDGEPVLMLGDEAERWAAERGAGRQAPEFFITERQRSRLPGAGTAAGRADHGTVGAVCLDGHGTLAAATSTGGIMGQLPGRVGDSPLIGAGTWADAHAAISCTGDGEAFIRSGVARHIAALREAGVELAEAASRALGEVERLAGVGGLIAVDAGGVTTMPFTTAAMPRGLARAGQEPEVWIGPA